MHGQGVAGADADHDVVVDGGTLGLDQDLDDLTVLNTQTLGVGGSHVDVTLGDDGTLGDLDLTCGADHLQTGGAGHVAALANGDVLQTQSAGVGVGQLDLVGLTGGTQDADHHLALGTDQLDLLVAGGELAGLAEHLLDSQLCALAVQGLDGLVGQVDVTGGGLNKNFVFHTAIPLSY